MGLQKDKYMMPPMTAFAAGNHSVWISLSVVVFTMWYPFSCPDGD